MKKIILLPMIVALVTVLLLFQNDAYAASYDIKDQASCQSLTNSTWNSGTCMLINATLTLANSDSLVVEPGITLSLNASSITSDGTITNHGTIENRFHGIISNSGHLTNDGGSINNFGKITNSGTLTNNLSSQINNRGGSSFSNTGMVVGSGMINSSIKVIKNTGTITDPVTIPNTTLFAKYDLNFPIIVPSGIILNVTHGVTLVVDKISIANAGNIANSGFIQNVGNITSSGTISNNGKIYEAPGVMGITNSGTLNNLSGGTIYNTRGQIYNFGTFSNSGTLTSTGTSLGVTYNSGTFSNSATVSNFGVISNNPTGTITSSGTWENNGIFSISNFGTFNNSGTLEDGNYLINNAGGTINNTGTITKFYHFYNNNGSTITNGGTITIGVFINNNGTITNTNSGVIHNDVGGSINNYNTITNNGTITNTSTCNSFGCLVSIISNSGTISNSGIVNNNAGTINNNAGSTINNNSSGTINNSGVINNAGTINNPGTINDNCGGNITGNAVIGNPPTNACSDITTTSVSLNPSALSCGSTTTVTANVTDTTANHIPSGAVAFSEFPAGGGDYFGTETCHSSSTNQLICTIPFTDGLCNGYSGRSTISAFFHPSNSSFSSSSGSASLQQYGSLDHTTTAVLLNPSTVNTGGQTVVNATITDTEGHVNPTGTVSWNDAGKGGSFGSVTCNPSSTNQLVCTATYTAPGTAGSVTITANYAGNAHFRASSGSSTLTVT